MAAIKSAADIAEKWARVTPQRQTDYEAGIAAPKADWETETAAAADAWAQGVTQAAANGSFGRGVRAAGTAKWRRKTQEVGPGRWGAGVRAAKQDYQQGFEPYRQVIETVSLPPRYPRGDERNLERVRAIFTALHQKKQSM